MGSNGQLYSLSWGEFSSSLTSAVQILRGHGDLVDVTLAAGGRSFPAHKIVLGAASPFLMDLLKHTPCQHPVILLAGIGATDLESVLEFVYRGEVSVEPSQLPSFLQAANCLSIHGLAPPTIINESGEEIPPPMVPSGSESPSRESVNSYLPTRKRKKKRKSSLSSGKWPRTSSSADDENRPIGRHIDNDKMTNYLQKDDDSANQGDDTSSNQLDHAINHQPAYSPTPQHLQPISTENSMKKDNLQSMGQQEQSSDNETQLHTLTPLQPYSPLHIPQFPGSLGLSLSTTMGVPHISTPVTPPLAHTTSTNTSKIRGASDCPGICPLCGATLRQARNLRRHLLSSCKYRFSINASHTNSTESMMMDIKTEEVKTDVDVPIYMEQSMNYGTDSRSSGYEQIICKPSPLPSPTGNTPNAVSPKNSIPSPTITR